VFAFTAGRSVADLAGDITWERARGRAGHEHQPRNRANAAKKLNMCSNLQHRTPYRRGLRNL
jgi:hypothetical protein